MWGAGTGATLGFLNTLTAPVRSAANQFLRNQAAAAISKSGLNTLRTIKTAPPLQGYLATLKLSANTPVFRGTAAVLTPPVAANVSNKTGFTGQIEGALNKVGPALDQLFSGTPEVIQQFGREQEKKGWGGAFETASYLMGPGVAGSIVTPIAASLTAPFLPNTQPAPVRRPIANLPPDYKQTELAAGAAAEAYRSGAGFPGQQSASRTSPGSTNPPAPPRLSPEVQAYNQERSRIAQLTAQNPEYQNIGQLRNALRDQGMAIWQQKYGNTPMGQPGGAVGMYNPLMQQTFGYQTGSAPDQQMGAPTQGPTPNIPQVDQSLNPASPTFIGGEGAPLMDFTKENLTPEMIELYQKQLMEQARRK